MEEKTGSSKVSSFWAGFALAFALPIILGPALGVLIGILGGVLGLFIPIILGILVLIVILISLKRNPKFKYVLLGVITAIGAGIIFFGTCAAGLMLSAMGHGPMGWNELNGWILSLPFAIGFALWFSIAIGRKLSKASEENKNLKVHEVWQD